MKHKIIRYVQNENFFCFEIKKNHSLYSRDSDIPKIIF